MAPRLLPIPTDIFKRIDETMANVDAVLGRVDPTLAEVATTLGEAGAVLSDVKALLGELDDKLELLDEVPAMKVKIEEIHRAVVGTTAKKK